MSSDWSFHNKTLIVSRCQPSLLSIVKINKKKIYDHKKTTLIVKNWMYYYKNSYDFDTRFRDPEWRKLGRFMFESTVQKYWKYFMGDKFFFRRSLRVAPVYVPSKILRYIIIFHWKKWKKLNSPLKYYFPFSSHHRRTIIPKKEQKRKKNDKPIISSCYYYITPIQNAERIT